MSHRNSIGNVGGYMSPGPEKKKQVEKPSAKTVKKVKSAADKKTARTRKIADVKDKLNLWNRILGRGNWELLDDGKQRQKA